MIEQDKGWGTECGRVVLCLVMRKGFSHKVVFEQRPQGCTVWRKGTPSGGNSKCKCLQESALGCGTTLQAMEAQFC